VMKANGPRNHGASQTWETRADGCVRTLAVRDNRLNTDTHVCRPLSIKRPAINEQQRPQEEEKSVHFLLFFCSNHNTKKNSKTQQTHLLTLISTEAANWTVWLVRIQTNKNTILSRQQQRQNQAAAYCSHPQSRRARILPAQRRQRRRGKRHSLEPTELPVQRCFQRPRTPVPLDLRYVPLPSTRPSIGPYCVKATEVGWAQANATNAAHSIALHILALQRSNFLGGRSGIP
jgi:hypothetical protein